MNRSAEFGHGWTNARDAALGKAEFNDRWVKSDPDNADKHKHDALAWRQQYREQA